MNARAHLPSSDAAPRDLRTEGGGGKIYPIDPAAWEHFKRVMAEQQQSQPRRPQPKPTGIKRGGNGRLDADLQERIDRLRERARQRAITETAVIETAVTEPKENSMTDLIDAEILAVHRRYTLLNMSLKDAAASASVSRSANWLRKAFKAQNLPVRMRGLNVWSAEAIERICAVHQLTIADLPVESLPDGAAQATQVFAREQSAAPPARPKRLEPTVVWRAGAPVPNPVPSGEQTAVSPAPRAAVKAPAPAAIGDLAVVNEQLAALQALLAQAEAKSVHISGRIWVELTAEVEL